MINFCLLPDLDERLMAALGESDDLTRCIENYDGTVWKSGRYTRLALAMMPYFRINEITKIIETYFSGQNWKSLVSAKWGRVLDIRFKKLDREFNVTRADNLLRYVDVPADGFERKMKLVNFVEHDVVSKYGNHAIIESFITDKVCVHFKLLKNTEKRDILKGFGSEIRNIKRENAKAQKQARAAEHKHAQEHIRCDDPSQRESEFYGLYEVTYDDSGRQRITPLSDKIAEHIGQNKKIITYADNVFVYDPECNYYVDGVYIIKSEIIRILKGIMTDTASNGISKIAYNVENILMQTNRVYEYPFTNESRVLPVLNGILRLHSDGKFALEPHDPDKYRFNYIIPINYDESVGTANVMNLLGKYADPDKIIMMLAQIIAQTVTCQPFKKAYFVYGEPNYGKSFIVIELIEKRFLLKGSVSKIPFTQLMTGNENRFSIASLEGKLANIKDELPYFNLKDANAFKEVTGSFDIWAEHKGKMGYATTSTAVHIFVGNQLASFDSAINDDDGFWTRVELVQFNRTQFSKNAKAADEIFTSEFMSGLLNRVLGVAAKMITTGELPYEADADMVRNEWAENSEPVYRFIRENMVPAKNKGEYTYILKKDMLSAVQTWYYDTHSDPKNCPRRVEQLTNVIRLAGGDLDSRATFDMAVKDESSPSGYAKYPDGTYVMEPTSNVRCYMLPYKWNDHGKYSGKLRKHYPAISIQTHIVGS